MGGEGRGGEEMRGKGRRGEGKGRDFGPSQCWRKIDAPAAGALNTDGV